MPCRESAFIQAFGDDKAEAFKDITDIVFDIKQTPTVSHMIVGGKAKFKEATFLKTIPPTHTYDGSFTEAAFIFTLDFLTCKVQGHGFKKLVNKGIRSVKLSDDGLSFAAVAYATVTTSGPGGSSTENEYFIVDDVLKIDGIAGPTLMIPARVNNVSTTGSLYNLKPSGILNVQRSPAFISMFLVSNGNVKYWNSLHKGPDSLNRAVNL